jgi:alpha/beta superfamily hydrolase
MSFQANTRRLPVLAWWVVFIVGVISTMREGTTALAQEPDVETAVCGSVREPLMFWLWRSTAGSPNPARLAHITNLEQIRFKTRDGIELGGYKLAAQSAKGYLLVAQGNAMLADQLVSDLQTFRDLGLDVYIFDYRGYGISKGKSRLVAIAGDYAEVVWHLNTLGYEKRLLYGISMGGVILLNAMGRSQAYTRLVVDSSPSRISSFGCPERYDPVAHLPEDSSRLMVVSGSRDEVVRPSQMDELIRVAKSRRGRVLQDNEFAHPYQDLTPATHRRRQNEVATFFLKD